MRHNLAVVSDAPHTSTLCVKNGDKRRGDLR